MKFYLFSLFIFGFTTAFSQGENSKFTIGFTYSPEIAYRILYKGPEEYLTSTTQEKIDARNENERLKYGHSFNLFIGHYLSERLTLDVGLGYTNFGEAQNPSESLLLNSEGQPYFTFNKSNDLHATSIPITLRVNLGGNRVKGFVASGISMGFIMKQLSKTTYHFPNGDQTTHEVYSPITQKNYNKIILGAHISGGIDLQCSEKASLRIAPILRFTTHSLYAQKEIRGNYFNAGIEIGTIFKL